MPQILGEAARRVMNGEQWHVTHTAALAQAEGVRAAHFEDDVWTTPALAAADRLGGDYVTVAEILNTMGVRLEQQTMPAQKRIGGILRTNGWRDKRKRIGGRLVWVWERIPLNGGGYCRGIHPEARQTADVPPYPPVSPYFEHLVKMEETGDIGGGGCAIDTGEQGETEPAISTFFRKQVEQGEQGDTPRQTLAKTCIPLPYPPAKEGDTSPPVDSAFNGRDVEEF